MEKIPKYDLGDFDFIRIVTPDINGCHLTKLVSSELAERIKNNEVDLYGGVIAMGPRTQYVEIQEFLDNKSQNAFFFPDLLTLRPIKWADDLERNFKVGEVIADMRWDVDKPLDYHPRVVAKRQIDRLLAMDLELYSAFEPEFRVFKPNTYEPYTTGIDMYKTTILSKYQNFFMDSVKQMAIAGIDIQDCCVEHGEAQLEMPLLPSYGIAAADKAFRFKQGIKELGPKHNLSVSFMTKPLMADSSSGNHFNHSLWYKSTKKNAMYNPSDEDHLSELTKYWLGGLLKHLPAISALCCPTVNCYRRLHSFISPTALNWNINDRFCSIRVKNFNEKNTYIENRLPSSASCPYHVVAATIASGIDGIVNKIQPPPKGDTSFGVLPNKFEEALDILDKDEVIKAALGPSFVNYFIKIKREADLKDAYSKKLNEEEQLNWERDQYFEYI